MFGSVVNRVLNITRVYRIGSRFQEPFTCYPRSVVLCAAFSKMTVHMIQRS